ncbi:hypothetical protein [Burkholderia gladioli]|uniref:hypothetical protein n=1 Tax=Burkholderia gladioli TaxID=28095 RepID=UPI00163FE00D|nr:hypothetical protein [Burkholderia gladioli]MDC6129626.1 hypothetical protein [Burkholderia gladioli]MDN7754829.1 hypothetical protein [Burkholderia gladioli]
MLKDFFSKLKNEKFLLKKFNRQPQFFRSFDLSPYAIRLRDIDELLAAREDWLSEFTTISDDEENWRSLPRPSRAIPFQLDYIYAELAAGRIIQISNFHKIHPKVAALCRQFERQFTGTISAKAFIVNGSQTFGRPRLEVSGQFIVPIAGQGMLHVYERQASNPRDWSRKIFPTDHDLKLLFSEDFLPDCLLYAPGGVPFSFSPRDSLNAWLEISVTSTPVSNALYLGISNMTGADACFNAPLIGDINHDAHLLGEAFKRAKLILGKIEANEISVELNRHRIARLPEVGFGYFSTQKDLHSIDGETEIATNPLKLAEVTISDSAIKIYTSSTIYSPLDDHKQPGFFSLPIRVKSEVEFMLNCTEPIKIKAISGDLDEKSKILLAREFLKIGILIFAK